MIELCRSYLYSTYQNVEGLSPRISELAKLNYIILNGIEGFFVKSNNEKIELSIEEFYNLQRQNLFVVEGELEDGFLKESIVDLRNKILEETRECKTSKQAFKKLMVILQKFNKEKFPVDMNYVDIPREGKLKQVFLSYAYSDKLYTFFLYNYFLSQGIFLYIDWMQNNIINDGRVLKCSLSNALEDSEQLLYLRSINSELRISGSHYIRPWCSWELGNFHRKCSGSGEKYYISLYRDDEPGQNLQMDGIKELKSIRSGKLSG